MKRQLKMFLFFGTIHLYGFEVNTHQAITRCAIVENISQCKTEGIKNLESFMTHSKISKGNIYEKQLFEKYKYKLTKKPITYIDYILGEEDAIKDYQVVVNGTYKGMIEAGVILEDAIYHDTGSVAQAVGVGRFNNHFYGTQIASTKNDCRQLTIPISLFLVGSFSKVPIIGGITTATGGVIFGNTELMSTNKTLCMGIGHRTDSIDWVFNKNVNLEFRHKNDYGIDDAFDYFKRSFSGLKKSDLDKNLSNAEIRNK